MSEAKFTRGPWTCEEQNDHGFNVIDGAGNVLMKCSFYTSAKRLEDDANVALVSTAPELYRALKDAVERLRFAAEKLDNADFVIDAMAKPFEDLLAKARGES